MMVIVIKAKKTKNRIIKRKFELNDYKNCLLNDEIILKSYQRFTSEARTEQIDKIGRNSIDDKRFQAFDRIASYPYGISNGKQNC